MINPNDTFAIENLERGEISFPLIPFNNNPLQRSRTTIRAAYTMLCNLDEIDDNIFEELEWDNDGDIDWQNNMLQHLHEIILEMISAYRLEENDTLLKKIFIYIQLWGGNMGKGVFVRNGGFNNNFDSAIYEDFVAITTEGNYNDARIKLNEMYGIRTAFSTKHIHFWSNTEAPIYDSIIAKIVFGRKNPDRPADYPEYMNALNVLDEEEGVTSSIIERSLFNWSDTILGKQWIALRIT